MVDIIKEKNKLIEEITRCLNEIMYCRDNYVSEEELNYETVKELSILVDKLWLKYYNLQKKICSKL